MPNTAGTLEFLVDGGQTLKAQENQINYAELAYEGQTLTFECHEGEPEHANKQVIIENGAAYQPLTLLLLGLNPGSTLSTVIAQGKIIVFHTQLWVSGAREQVVGVR